MHQPKNKKRIKIMSSDSSNTEVGTNDNHCKNTNTLHNTSENERQKHMVGKSRRSKRKRRSGNTKRSKNSNSSTSGSATEDSVATKINKHNKKYQPKRRMTVKKILSDSSSTEEDTNNDHCEDFNTLYNTSENESQKNMGEKSNNLKKKKKRSGKTKSQVVAEKAKNKVEKKRRGRKPAVPAEVIVQKLEGVDIFDENQQLKKETCEIWNTACEKLDFKVAKHNLYLKFLYDVDNIKTDLLRKKNEQNSSHIEVDPKSSNESSKEPLLDTTEGVDGLFNDVFLKPMIKEYSTDPFHVFYSSMDQRYLYQDFFKKVDFPVIISSSVQVSPQIICNEETNTITSFVVHTQINGEPISFYQSAMVRTDEQHMQYLLSEWLREKIAAPHHVICSISQLDAVMMAFNFTTIADYSKKMLQSVYYPQTKRPATIIQIDSMSFITEVKELIDECFIDDLTDVKLFHLESLIYLMLCTEFDEFNLVMKKLLCILKSTYLNDQVRGSIKDLRQMCSQLHVQRYIEKFHSFNDGLLTKGDDQNPETTDLLSRLKIKDVYVSEFLQETYVEAKKDCAFTGTQKNAYENKDYFTKFMEILGSFSVWTWVSIPKNSHLSFEYEEISNSYWRAVNESSEIRENAITIEDYIPKHVMFLNNQIQKCRELLSKKKIIRKDEDVTERTSLHSCLNSKENWMGKIETEATKEMQNSSILRNNESTFTDIDIYSPIEKQSTVESPSYTHLSIIHKNKTIDECISSQEQGPLQEIDSFDSSLQEEHDYSAKKQINLSTKNLKKGDPIMHSTPKYPDKVGKFTTAFAAVKALLNKPSQKNVTKKLIKNKKPNQIKKKQYYFENTTSIDSIAELFIQAICNYYTFKDYSVENTKSILDLDFLKSCLAYANSGKLSDFYKDRLILFMEMGQMDGDILSFREKLSNGFSTLMHHHPSITKKKNCDECKNMEISYLFTIKNIPNGITVEHCSECNELVIVSFEIGNYVAFDYEDKTELSDIYKIKENLDINGRKFQLAGVIGYEKSKVKENFIHYVTYSRPIKGA